MCYFRRQYNSSVIDPSPRQVLGIVFRITKALDAHLLRAHRLTERCRVWGAQNSDSVSVLFELGLVMIVTLAEATHSLTLPERMRGFG